MNYWTIGKYAGGIILGLGLAWTVYAGIIRPTTKPNPTTRQEATTIINHTSSPKATFGCSNVRIYEERNEQSKP